MPGGFVELPLEGRSMDGGERGGGEEEAGGGEGERRGAGGQKDAMSLLKGIRELFGQMDVDADGKVSLRELREGLRRQRYLLTKEEAQHMLEAMDVDADGNISFPAFVAAIIDWRALEGTAEWMSATQRVFKVNAAPTPPPPRRLPHCPARRSVPALSDRTSALSAAGPSSS